MRPLTYELDLCDLVTLTFDLWSWTKLQHVACDVMKLCTTFERNRAIHGGVIAISVFDLMTLNTALCVALGSEIIFTTLTFDSLIRAWIIAFSDAHTLWSWPLTSWPWTSTALWVSYAFELCTKFERNRISHPWVIDDLARFGVQFYGWRTTVRAFSWVRGPNFTKLGQDIGQPSRYYCTLLSEFGYLAAFSNEGVSKLSDVLNDAKFRTFWPPLWKLGEG